MFKAKKEWNGKTEGKRSERGRGLHAAAGLLVGLALIVFVVPRSAMADTFFSDLGSPVSYQGCCGWIVSGGGSVTGSASAYASLFTSLITGSVTQIDVGVTYNTSTPLPFDASVWTENASDGLGTELASWTNLTPTASLGTSSNSLVTISDISGLSLTAGTSYFVVLTPTSLSDDSLNIWNVNAQGVDGLVLFSSDDATWVSDSTSNPIGAFDILGTAASPAPEASSMALLGIVMLAFMGLVVSKKLPLAHRR